MNEERKRILKLVEEGQLTAEEAIMLLEALEHKEKREKAIPSTDVDLSGEKQEHKKASAKQDSPFYKFADFIDSAVKKIKDFDLDFNFGPPIEVNHIYQHRDVYLERIDIDVANGEIKLVPWDEGDVRVECQAKVYRAKDQEEARKLFLQQVLFSVDGGKMRFTIPKKQMKVLTTFYIPRSDYKEISLRMFNGPITGDAMKANTFKAQTANGNIHIASFVGEEIELETANGHITLESGQAKECEAETINGKITISGAYEKTDLNSFNGNIVLRVKSDLARSIFLKTTTGNIDVYVPTTQRIDGYLKSNFGGFQCEVEGLELKEEKKDVVQKSLKFTVNKASENLLRLEAEAATGSIVVKNDAEQ